MAYFELSFNNGVIVLVVGCLTIWVQPTCIVEAHSWACSKSLQSKFFPFIEKWPKDGEVWLLLMRSAPKSACHFLGQWLGRVRHPETDREEKKKNKGHSALWAELKQRAILGHCVWVPERAKHKWELQLEEVQSVQRNREKHSESVREWKRKRRHFSLLELHTKKINW